MFDPELVVYNAGTDILDGDPLGRLKISSDGIANRDEKVFRFARERTIPIVMLTSGSLSLSPFLSHCIEGRATHFSNGHLFILVILPICFSVWETTFQTS
ncbi:hypothetical protein F2P56_012202 [Juglans regia]|uniref:Histone deacetylase domain-containing protein n=1 Tax=Juglans regia TaxID=51240 RepID=A0A834CYK1_JUGRE|nr:hypothetical protein F2P56_012202 [Juglans regia]